MNTKNEIQLRLSVNPYAKTTKKANASKVKPIVDFMDNDSRNADLGIIFSINLIKKR